MPLRILQVSDFHLGSRLSGSRLALPSEKQERIRRDIQQALRRAAELARSEEVDAVVVPGDLWDDESVSIQTATFAYDVFASLAPIPVLIAPGNHDAYHAFSYHNPKYFLDKTGRSHPANVHVFSSEQVRPVRLEQVPGATFYGNCFTTNRPATDRMMATLRPEESEGVHVLLWHGSQDDSMVSRPDQEYTAPFNSEELLATGFDYVALGHYHRHSVVTDAQGRVRGAYGGIPVARGLDETGERFGLVVDVDPGGVDPDNLHPVTLDNRHVKKLNVPFSPDILNSDAARELVSDALSRAGVAPDDMVYVVLEGRVNPDAGEFDFHREWCDTKCFHLVVDQSLLEPDYQLEGAADESDLKRVEGQFAARMRVLLDEAEGDPERTRLVKQAYSLGMEALHHGTVGPRRVY